MSTTDAALDWLLSLSATLTSSPVPNSDSPDFTDWLRVSPATSSPTTSEPPSSSLTSPPLLDVTSSSRVNALQSRGLLNYFYDPANLFSAEGSATSESQNGRVLEDALVDGLAQAPGEPALFNEHNRMISLDSVTATLVNTPSPRSTRLLSAGPTGVLRNENDNRSPFSSLFYSPATKYMQDLQGATFGSYLNDLVAPALPSQTPADVSPVVRASNLEVPTLSDDKENYPKSKTKSKAKAKRSRRSKHAKPDLSFVEKLRAVEAPANVASTSAIASREDTVAVPLSGLSFEAPLVLPSHENVLMSPCRLETTRSISAQHEEDLPLPILPMLSFENSVAQDSHQNAPSTPTLMMAPIEALSPLTPLTSLSSSPPEQRPRLKIILNLKRLREEPTEEPTEADTAVRRSKRPRRNVILIDSPSVPTTTSPTQSSQSSSAQTSFEDPTPVYTKRTLPSTIEVSDNYPLFYRRFPASSYYIHGSAESPCTLFGAASFGGNYNPPRTALDLYTPRFVKGKGTEKVGLCPVCVEPPERGGERKKLWLAMKFSAFKCVFCFSFFCPHLGVGSSYHMQYAHGISASTGRPFSPPVAFRIIPRPNPGKKEKHQIQQGKCHNCGKWVAVEGVKDMESKVKELHWWKHAAACHQESSLEGEGDYFEDDHVLSTLLALTTTERVDGVIV